MTFNLSKNDHLGAFLANCCTKVLFSGPYCRLNYFCHTPVNFSRQGAKKMYELKKRFLRNELRIRNLFYKRFVSLSVTHCLQLKIFGWECRIKKFGDLSRVPSNVQIFSGKNFKRKKTSAID